MRIGFTYRLFLAILTATVLAVVCMFLIMKWNIDRGFHRYVDRMEQKRFALLASRLKESYAVHGKWDFLRRGPLLWRQLVDASMSEVGPWRPGMPEERPPMGEGEPPDRFFPPLPRFAGPFVLLDAGKGSLFGSAEIKTDMDLKPIHHKNEVVGYPAY
jgi:hypothetical protein